ncbi:tautomerase family protein [Pseudomonas asturiensis]|nr:tautomerase family protein [Pseudomonas asturiensis]
MNSLTLYLVIPVLRHGAFHYEISIMPLINIDLIEGRSDDQVKILLDAVHRAVVEAFQVPEGDRYQIVNEHRPSRMIVEDTGLGIPRTDKVVMISVTSRPRTEESKVRFYQLLAQALQEDCGIDANDLMVSIVTNTDADWSFGHGRAQFLTGEL